MIPQFFPPRADLPSRPVGDAIPDDQLAIRVAERLSEQLPPVGHRIVVEAQNGVVILEGLVPSEAIQRRVHVVVCATHGVFDVSDQLSVRPVPR